MAMVYYDADLLYLSVLDYINLVISFIFII